MVVYVIGEFGLTVDRNRRHHAEPRQQVNAPMALSLRDDPKKARPLTELAGPPTIVASRPFGHRTHADRLDPLSPRCRCDAQLVLLGGGTQPGAVLRGTVAHGVGVSAELCRELTPAANLGVPSPTSRLTAFTDVLGAGRPLVAQANLVTAWPLVSSGAGLVYVRGMVAALLRLLTKPGLRHRMAACVAEAARRHRRRRIPLRQFDEAYEYA
jgi:hypothetical protein